tara:strand:+ start:546 stop:1664 length:1119 start_codon:yes stop_codon:yes gene_type:complete
MSRHQRLNTYGITKTSLFQRLHLDPLLTTFIFILSLTGIILLFSASSGGYGMVNRQVIRLLVAFIFFLLFAQVPAYKYKHWAPYLFSIGMVLLISVLLIGKVGKGAQRWLDLGFFRFQPSEIMKIIVPMMLAWYFSHQLLPIHFKNVIWAALIIILPALLIVKQPDLGTALMLIFSGCVVLFFAGISYRLIALFSVFCLALAPFLWHMMHGYQKLRVLNFLDPERDPLGSGYHIIQSKIAIGSGGLLGKGFLNGSQSHLHFLPEHATDFIFAVLGEEVGLIGCLLVIFLFFLIVYRSLHIAYLSQDIFSKLLVVSLSMNFFLSAFVNMGMVAGILPVVGIPLPLVSYGGSSMLVFFASFGMIMSVASAENSP